ncbi:hypothetical protein [Rhizobium sullae]|uniref:Uncharacterized protein n=1 Tax=Rhizobium sullae TaxID=50338 RepID=A0A4R3PUE3_RHISU|nr:hypothetical protein [Rhizobium sullae]TCU09670.1 hypothetical protein EV132_12470 [Rhizobium sullae]
MVGKKTHEQQLRVIEKRENTANADKDFDAAADLKKTEAAKKAYRKGQSIGPSPEIQEDDRSVLRGRNQESPHRKRGGA